MTTPFPVPIRFELPGDAWQPVPPASLGVDNALFLSVRRGTPGEGYEPTIVFSGGWRTDDATLEEIADEAVAALRDQTGEAQLLDRRSSGGEQNPACSQVVRSSITVDGTTMRLVRLQALLGLVDPANPRRRAVLIVSCTSLAEQVSIVSSEFEQLVQGIRVDAGPAAG